MMVSLPDFPTQFVRPRNVDVWFPPSYTQQPDRRYPVIYMHDGQNLFDGQKAFTGIAWEVDRAIHRIAARNPQHEAIIVGIWNTDLRYHEYMPRKAVQSERVRIRADDSLIINTADIVSDNYLRFLVNELKPHIDQTYRTQSDRLHTIIMGSSMGGLISAYAMAEYPDIFGAAGCVSTHWLAGDGVVIDYLAAHMPAPASHRFYFDYGSETLDALYAPYQARMDEVMKEAGYVENESWITRSFPGADHSESAWRERVDIPLAFLLK